MTAQATETREVRIKRLKMRSMRRGIREMDLILQAFAEARLEAMEERDLDLYDQLLGENDQDLYTWVTGQVPAAPAYAEMIDEIASNYRK